MPAIAQIRIYQVLSQHLMYVILGGYLGLNMLQNIVSSTGAFEITCGNRVIFSKLDSGRMPTLDELLKKLP